MASAPPGVVCAHSAPEEREHVTVLPAVVDLRLGVEGEHCPPRLPSGRVADRHRLHPEGPARPKARVSVDRPREVEAIGSVADLDRALGARADDDDVQRLGRGQGRGLARGVAREEHGNRGSGSGMGP